MLESTNRAAALRSESAHTHFEITRDSAPRWAAWSFSLSNSSLQAALDYYCAIQGCDPLDCHVRWYSRS